MNNAKIRILISLVICLILSFSVFADKDKEKDKPILIYEDDITTIDMLFNKKGNIKAKWFSDGSISIKLKHVSDKKKTENPFGIVINADPQTGEIYVRDMSDSKLKSILEKTNNFLKKCLTITKV